MVRALLIALAITGCASSPSTFYSTSGAAGLARLDTSGAIGRDLIRALRAGNLEHAARLSRGTGLEKRILIREERWRELAASRFAGDSAVRSFAAFAAQPKQVIKLNARQAVAPLRWSEFGTPLVELVVGGRTEWFWLDTGADFTILGSDIAAQLGINSLGPSFRISTSASNGVMASPAVVPELKVGALSIYNHRVLVVASKDLEVEHFWGLEKELNIRGILGWNFIRMFDVDIDPILQDITLTHPRNRRTASRDIVWMGAPYVIAHTMLDNEAFFRLDTGAANSYLSPHGSDVFNATVVGIANYEIVGVGGVKSVKLPILDSIAFRIGTARIQIDQVTLRSESTPGQITADGVIGADILRSHRVHISWYDGTFAIN